MAVTFDGVNLEIILPTVGTYDAQIDLYSDWKEWILLGNAGFPQAFDTTGGDPISATESVAPYFFLRNDLGWRIRAPNEDGEVLITGNLFGRDPTLGTFLPSIGGFTVLIRLQVSAQGTVTEVGTSGLTTEESEQLDNIHARNWLKRVTSKTTGVETVFESDGVTVRKQFDLWEDEGETQRYRGLGINVVDPIP